MRSADELAGGCVTQSAGRGGSKRTARKFITIEQTSGCVFNYDQNSQRIPIKIRAPL